MKTTKTTDQITHTPTCFEVRARRAFARAGNIAPGPHMMRQRILSMQGVPTSPSYSEIRRYRNRNVPVVDCLAVPVKDRCQHRGFRLLRHLGKDAPGSMVTFEIECFVPAANTQALRASLPMACEAVGDGSLTATNTWRTRYGGIEIRVPCRLDDFRLLYRVCNLLSKHSARVNASCGLHVHLDVRDLAPTKRLADVRSRAMALHGVIASVLRYAVPPSRLANSYCALTTPSTRDRYHAVNLTAVEKHGTIEVRLGAGTVQADKARLWAEVCAYFLRRPLSRDSKARLPHVGNATQALSWVLKSDLPPSLVWWLVQRIQRFYPAAIALPPDGSTRYELGE